SFLFGNVGDKPFVGDFNGDGVDTMGLHRESTGLVYFRNANSTGVAHASFIYGNPGDKIVAGDWDGDGDDAVGVYRPSAGMLYVRNANTAGNADSQVYVGAQTGVVAINP
ncbi:MAG: nuclease, partial [Actinobacteria bacterium]|nr:nuclease [Actinomycetota bacterium]